LLGAMIEGESVLLAAAYAVNQQYLLLWPVIVCGVCGAVLSDHLYFYVGRTQGSGWLMRHENVRRRAIRVQGLVQRHETRLLIGFRFMIGFRTITPLLLGMAGVGRLRFFIFDLIASIAWATVVTLCGHWIVMQLQRWSGDSIWVEDHLMLVLLLTALVIGMCHLWWMRRKKSI
jgi:membrane protein DedA with SNARE-associated domain